MTRNQCSSASAALCNVHPLYSMVRSARYTSSRSCTSWIRLSLWRLGNLCFWEPGSSICGWYPACSWCAHVSDDALLFLTCTAVKQRPSWWKRWTVDVCKSIAFEPPGQYSFIIMTGQWAQEQELAKKWLSDTFTNIFTYTLTDALTLAY